MRLKDRVEWIERYGNNIKSYLDTYFEEIKWNKPLNCDILFSNENSLIAQSWYFINDVRENFEYLLEENKDKTHKIKSLEERVEKQEETIKDLMELCEPLLEERLAKSLGKVNDILELSLKDLFSSEPAKKCKKSAKSSAEKCKKCGESTKTTKKTSKKGEK